MKKKYKNKLKQLVISSIIIVVMLIIGYFNPSFQGYINEFLGIEKNSNTQLTGGTTTITSFDLNSIPKYDKSPYVYINNNVPNFTENDYTTEAFENYSKLDNLGRCGVAYANICKETMPAEGEKRGNIGAIHPSGWKSVRYDIVEGKSLYNRSHLIGWQLAGENDNKLNLITGTRYMNVEGMLPFENIVDDYFESENSKNNHVLYRVTPIFEGNNLIASGVQMEAYSVEDNGKGVSFNVYVYNVQPGILINYETGESSLEK